jgi:hypothetical protein
MLIPQTRGFTAVQNLPVDEFRVVMTAGGLRFRV